MSEQATCAAPYLGDPKRAKLYCLKLKGHKDEHATCLGYHPPPRDEYEWATWPREPAQKVDSTK